jgi:FkbH-like protein
MIAAGKPGIAVAATFTSDGITAAMTRRLDDPDRRVKAAPYGQLVEPMLDPGSVLLANAGVNVLLVRPEDLRGYATDPATGDRLLSELISALRAAPNRSAATWLVTLTPPSRRALADRNMADWIEAAVHRIADAIEPLPGIYRVPLDDLVTRYGVLETHDEYANRMAHLPYTESFSDALADWLVRLAETTWRRPRKVVVLDCDNTLWAGVCGELGPRAVSIGQGHRRVQEFMLDQRARGKLLCLCSRNNEADVDAVFAEHPGMAITQLDITARRIGWAPKVEYLRELSIELGLALSSFVFVDDDPVECAAVRAQLPEVAVVHLAGDGAHQQLAHERAFDQLTVTDEDRLRADWYSVEPERQALRQSTSDYDEFLDRCAIEVIMADLTDTVLERAAQLTARTTQFTLTGISYTVPQLRQLIGSGGRGWTVRVRDVFGDYGTVGLVLAEVLGDALEVPALLLSCRVLNRRVETEVLRFLCDNASAAGCRTVRLAYRPTKRNLPARQFLEQVSGAVIGVEDLPGSVSVPVVP